MEIIVWRPKPAFLNVARAIVAGKHDVPLIIEDGEGDEFLKSI